MKKLVIFDLDGTLVNTISDLAASVNHALAANGYPQHPTDRYPMFVGNGIYKLIERALPENSRNQQVIQAVKADFMAHYMLHNTDHSTVYPFVSELLRQLQAKGVMVAVLSNKVHQATVAMMEKLFPDINFCCVFGQRDGIPTKPDPVQALQILQCAKVSKDDVLYVGDSGVDMQTAHNAGLTAVGVTWGLRPETELRQNSADIVINHPLQLLEHL